MAKKAKKKKAAWTVMVYLAGDNNLTTECMFALTEMKDARLNREVNVVAQFDPSDPFVPAHRYEINRSTKNSSLYHDIIDRARFRKGKGEVNFSKESRKAISLAETRRAARKAGTQQLDKASLTTSRAKEVVTDETETGSPITLYNFISFCIEKYPAKRYMVVLSGHAGGTERDYLMKDESPTGSLTFNELKQVFKRIKKDRSGKIIDIIGMDNCLMSMAEICYELRGLADVVVGCESYSPASGWPYRQILERLSQNFVNPELASGQSVNGEASKAIVDEYVNYYGTYWMAGLSVTQSALNVRRVEKLQSEINKLAQAMEQKLIEESETKAAAPTRPKRDFANALVLAHWEAQSYNGEQFVDLYDFCDCLKNRLGPGPIADQCEELKKFIDSDFVLRSCFCGAVYQYSFGVSIYFPWAQIAPSYLNLDFIKNSGKHGWGSFLKSYTKLTRRLPRGVNDLADVVIPADAGVESVLEGNETPDSRMMTDRMMTDRMMTDRMMTDRMMTDRSGAPRILSMRNPPDIFLPDECIRDRKNAWEGQLTLRDR